MEATILASLVAALIQVESGGQSLFVQHDGNSPSYGCAQIKLATAKGIDSRFTAVDLMDCSRATPIAATYLASHYKKYGSWRTALCRYNTGKPLKDCTYARKVLSVWLNQ